MPAGLTSVTFRGLGAEEIVRFARDCSLECIEWGADVHARPDDCAALDKIVRLGDEYGVKAVSYGSYYRAGAENEFSAREVIAAAKRLGVERIRVWAGAKSSSLASRADFDCLAADLRNFAELAAKDSLVVATEFHHDTFADTADSALELLRAVPGLRTYWQENPQISALENYCELKRLLPYAETVHTFCFDSLLNRYPLVDAKERWQGYVCAVKEAGKKDMPFLLEFVRADSKEQAADDARQLRKWLEGDFA